MKHLNDVHTVAERYLWELERGGKATFYAPADNRKVAVLADTITERVVVKREIIPDHFVGFKSNGVPVWSHDLKLAASYDSASMKLVNVLRALKRNHGVEAETWPAAWFSNYQDGGFKK